MATLHLNYEKFGDKMKYVLSCIIMINLFGTSEVTAKKRVKKPKPKPVVVVQELDEEDDDEDEKVVLASFGTMAQSIAQLSLNPTDPAVAGPAIASFIMSIANMVVQLCKNMPTRDAQDVLTQLLENWYDNLSPEAQQDLIKTILKLNEETVLLNCRD